MKQLCFPIQAKRLPLPSEALAQVILDVYRQPWTLNGIRAEARRLHCPRWYVLPFNRLLRHIAECRLAEFAE